MSLKHNSNSFDLLRLVAASAVLISHQFQILGRPEPPVFGIVSLGFFAVLVFFTLSGRLITQSWERDPRVKNFLLKRCLRIFPALAVVVVLTVFMVGPVFTTLSLREYFSKAETWEYFRCAVLWTKHVLLPGVFETNPHPSVVNPSLWTLPIEFALYISVLAAGLLGILRGKYMVSIGLIGLSLLAAMAPFSGNINIMNLTIIVASFWWGSWQLLFFKIDRACRIDQLLGIAALIIIATVGSHSIARAGLIIFASGLVWGASKLQFGDQITRRLGDLSYGIYIIAYPVQQSLVAAFGKGAFSYAEYLTMSCAIVFPLSLLSWHLLEKHCIRMKAIFLNSA